MCFRHGGGRGDRAENWGGSPRPDCGGERVAPTSSFYEHENSNIHRAAHTRATDAYQGSRETVRRFLDAPSANESVFARGTTEAIDLVAKTWGARFLERGGEVLSTWLEHHANGKAEVLEVLPPWQGGGTMIRDVTFEKTQFQGAPARFEAGTPNIADAVGLGAALAYVSSLGPENIARYEHELLAYATERLTRIPGLRLYGTAKDEAGVLSFTLEGLKTEDIGVALDREGIAVRAGRHSAPPILRRFGQETTVRASACG